MDDFLTRILSLCNDCCTEYRAGGDVLCADCREARKSDGIARHSDGTPRIGDMDLPYLREGLVAEISKVRVTR